MAMTEAAILESNNTQYLKVNGFSIHKGVNLS